MKKELIAGGLVSILAVATVGLVAARGGGAGARIEQKVTRIQRRDAGSFQYPIRVGEQLCELELLKQGKSFDEACE